MKHVWILNEKKSLAIHTKDFLRTVGGNLNMDFRYSQIINFLKCYTQYGRQKILDRLVLENACGNI